HNDILAQLGEIHYGRKKVQPANRDVRRFYEQAAALLRHRLLSLGEEARQEIASVWEGVIENERYTCYACAIMPDHIHILLRKHKHQAEDMMEALKNASRDRLLSGGCWPADHPIWTGGGGWKVFLDHPDEVCRTIGYIDGNPRSAGLPDQHWRFVKVYDGWPLHPGHNPNSPYARRLRRS
ncbi:MAG TPA: transposase, partial [Gemmataceae bacterium]|nr:transposase [Gemmataceae bacterium]